MKTQQKGFTLVELLVVIAIISVLAAVVVLIINPLELTRRSRDAARLTDLANLQQAINVAVQESQASSDVILCLDAAANPAAALATPCKGMSSDVGSRASDASGWVKVDLGTSKSVSVPTLPVDPVNTTGATGYHYTYCSDGSAWEINARLESEQQISKMDTDGGDETSDGAGDYSGAKYEVGSNLTLINPAGACTYE
jgi:prepilin-type N-terminal cleavage/methylation domain-containing protein